MMKIRHLVLATLLLVLVGCQPSTEPSPEPAPRQIDQYSIGDFLDTTSFGGGYFSPDNSKILVHSNKTGVFNAYSIPVAGGEPVQLTTSTEDSIFVQSYFPEDERFLYTSDVGGNELNHIFVRELDGTASDLTPGENLKAQFRGWAQDDRSFFIATNERDARNFDLYEYQLDGYGRELFYQNDEAYAVADISPDRRYVALIKVHTRADTDIYLHDRESGENRHLTPHEGEIRHSVASFSFDGRSLLITTDEGSEFSYLKRMNLESGGLESGDLESGTGEIIEKVNWDVMFASLTKKGTYLVVGINNDARTELKLYEAATMKPVPLPQIDADITNVAFSRDETHLRFFVNTGQIPSDLFVSTLTGEPRQLTHSLSEKIEPDDLVNGEVVRFTSFDGMEIPGILYKPHQASSDNKVPALVWVHGGPGGQSRFGYIGLLQYLINHGYAVYAINNRGSSGYGKTFFKADDRDHGKGDLSDCVASKQMLIDTGYVDGDRIGIIGGSYGGYMVLAALTFQPDEFKVGVDVFGPSNWLRTLQSIPPWWETARKSLAVEMGDFDDEEYLKSISPLFHAHNIVKPLMVLQGANDPRVLQVESDEIVEAARANGTPVEYLVFEDEGHGFRKKENEERGYKAVLDFLDKHLRNVPQSGNVG